MFGMVFVTFTSIGTYFLFLVVTRAIDNQWSEKKGEEAQIFRCKIIQSIDRCFGYDRFTLFVKVQVREMSPFKIVRITCLVSDEIIFLWKVVRHSFLEGCKTLLSWEDIYWFFKPLREKVKCYELKALSKHCEGEITLKSSHCIWSHKGDTHDKSSFYFVFILDLSRNWTMGCKDIVDVCVGACFWCYSLVYLFLGLKT